MAIDTNANLMSISCNNRNAIVSLRPLRNSLDRPNVNSIDGLDYRVDTVGLGQPGRFRGERATRCMCMHARE